MNKFDTFLAELSSRTKTKFIKLAEPKAKELGFIGTIEHDEKATKKADRTLKRISKLKRERDLGIKEDLLIETHLDTYNGTKLFSTIHYEKRNGERNPNEDSDKPIVKDIFRKAIDHLSNNSYGNAEHFLFYSKKHNRAVVFNHRPDKFNKKDPRKHMIATTILPSGKRWPQPGTVPVMVENLEAELLIIDIE